LRNLAVLLIVLSALAPSLCGQVVSLQSAQSQTYQQAVELYHKEQYGNAQKIFDAVADNDLQYGRSLRASAAYYAARCAIYLYHGDIKERVEGFAENYELNPLVDQLYLKYAHNLFSLKRYRQASEYYQKTNNLAVNPAQVEEYEFKLAYSLMSLERGEEAQKLFFKLKNGSSSYAASSKYYYAHLLYANENYTQALPNFLALQGDASFGGLVPYYLAQIYYQLKNYEQLIAVGEDLVMQANQNRAPEIAKLVADAFYEKKDYANTLKYLNLYSKKGGRMRLSDFFQKGYAYYQQKNYYSAIENFNKISAGPLKLQQNSYYHLADCYLKVDQKYKARNAFKAAAEINELPQIKEDAAFNYAKLAYELSDPFQDAITTLKQFLKDYPSTQYAAEVNGYLANLYITTKDYDRALKAIKRSGINSPEMRAAYQRICYLRATELFNSRKYQAAVRKYKEGLNYAENINLLAKSHYWLGESYYRLLEYDKALQSFNTFRKSPGAVNSALFERSYYSTAYAHYKKMNFENAVVSFRQFINGENIEPSAQSDAFLRLGDSYLLLSKYTAAANFYQKALKADIKEKDYAFFQKAQCQGLAGKPQQKIKALEDLLKQYPQSDWAQEAQLEIAQTYLQLDQNENALQALADFEAGYPNSTKMATAHLKRGLIYSNTDQNIKALAAFKNIVAQYPGSQEAIEAIGLAEIVYKRQQNIDAYLDWVNKIDFVNFEESLLDSTAFNAAYDLYAQSLWNKALSSYQGYLNRFENGIFKNQARYYAAQCAIKLKQGATAYDNFLVLAQNPTSAYQKEALLYLARYRQKAGSMAEARQWYQRFAALKLKPELEIEAQKGLMETAMALGDFKEAALRAKLLLKKENLNSDLLSEARLTEARAYYLNEDWDEARQAYQNLITLSAGEDLAESYYYLAQLLSKNEQYEASNAEVNRLIEDLPSFKEWKLKALLVMAENFWQMEDIFQANYIIDFILETDYSPQLNQSAEALRDKIQTAEANALQAKKELLQKQAVPIELNAADGLQLIDAPEEAPLDEPLEPKDPQ
jgi:tetratricopeptide (TPR) repeat protein